MKAFTSTTFVLTANGNAITITTVEKVTTTTETTDADNGPTYIDLDIDPEDFWNPFSLKSITEVVMISANGSVIAFMGFYLMFSIMP